MDRLRIADERTAVDERTPREAGSCVFVARPEGFEPPTS